MTHFTVIAILALTLSVSSCVQALPPDATDPQVITDCQVIDEPGPYIVLNPLPGTGGLLTGAEADWVDAGDCLAIDAEHVSIDGQGFAMTGNATTGDGVRVNSAGSKNEYIEIRNLNIADFYRGVDLEGAFFSVIENVSVVSSVNHGITIHSGQTNRVLNNNAVSNGVAGMRVSLRSIVKNNIANGNGGVGIFADAGSVVTGNVAVSNDGDGIAVTCESLVSGNVATDNAQVAGVDIDLSGAGCTSVNNVETTP